MTTMVDAFGPAACCECCNRDVDESELQTMDNGAEFCRLCAGLAFGIQADLDDRKQADSAE